MSTFAGVAREVPIVPFNVAAASILVRGMVVQWNAGTSVVEPWSIGTNIPFGVCCSDADLNLLSIDVMVGKGSSVLVKCNTGIVPFPSQLLYWAAAGVVNVTVLNTPVAKSIGFGLNGFVEAILV
jgi:hypothetical protein